SSSILPLNGWGISALLVIAANDPRVGETIAGRVPCQRDRRRSDASVKIPLFTSLRGYDRAWLRGDLIAGLTVWAVLVPEALAYGTIAAVSPVVGLSAAPPALILYAAFGSSKHLVVGPMAATAALSAAAVADLVSDPKDVPAFTAVVALMTGLLALGAGLFRL